MALNASRDQQVQILGVPMDLGQALRGVDMGPSAVRYAGLLQRIERLGYMVTDAGNIPVPIRDNIADQRELHFLPAIVEVLEQTYAWTVDAMRRSKFPVFIGGDHSIAIGTVGGVTNDARGGVIWIDSHGDYNTFQTSPSGNVHGMPLAALLGHGHPDLVNLGREGPKLRAEDVVMIGIRDLDPAERRSLRASGITVFTMREVDERGIGPVTRAALEHLAHVDRLHVSLDVDAVDPSIAPGVGTPVPGGLTYREAHLLMEILADCGCVTSVDVTEVNPILDVANRTGEMAVELVASLLGKAIL